MRRFGAAVCVASLAIMPALARRLQKHLIQLFLIRRTGVRIVVESQRCARFGSSHCIHAQRPPKRNKTQNQGSTEGICTAPFLFFRLRAGLLVAGTLACFLLATSGTLVQLTAPGRRDPRRGPSLGAEIVSWATCLDQLRTPCRAAGGCRPTIRVRQPRGTEFGYDRLPAPGTENLRSVAF